MSKDSMRIWEVLINFIEDLIARNQSFRVNLGVNWKKLKFGDWNWSLENLVGQIRGLIVRKKLKFDSQLGNWLKKFKTKDQIVKGARLHDWNWPNQGPNWRKLKVWWSIKVQMLKLKTKDQDENDTKL
jgi:hypothetical protein